MRNISKQSGFTLFELLVATTVFAIVSYMAYTGLAQVMDAREHTQRVEERLTEIQKTFLSLERDLQQIAKRQVRDGYGDPEGELVGDVLGTYMIKLTRGGRYIPEGSLRSRLQRVAYQLEDEVFYRIIWPVLDQAQDTEPKRVRLLADVEKVEILYLNNQSEWIAQWNSIGNTGGQPAGAAQGGVPRAVAVNITLKDYGSINRMFILPEA